MYGKRHYLLEFNDKRFINSEIQLYSLRYKLILIYCMYILYIFVTARMYSASGVNIAIILTLLLNISPLCQVHQSHHAP